MESPIPVIEFDHKQHFDNGFSHKNVQHCNPYQMTNLGISMVVKDLQGLYDLSFCWFI